MKKLPQRRFDEEVVAESFDDEDVAANRFDDKDVAAESFDTHFATTTVEEFLAQENGDNDDNDDAENLDTVRAEFLQLTRDTQPLFDIDQRAAVEEACVDSFWQGYSNMLQQQGDVQQQLRAHKMSK